MSVTITKTRTKEIGPNMEQTIKVVTETTQEAPEPVAKTKPLAESAPGDSWKLLKSSSRHA